jgi:mono/diheme cytochrome c family protein
MKTRRRENTESHGNHEKELSNMRRILVTLAMMTLPAAAAFGADAKAGQAAYDKACKSCHGADGTANASLAKMLKADIKDLKSSDVQGQGDAALKAIVTDGKGKMKPVKTLAAAEVDDVVAYVRTLKK